MLVYIPERAFTVEEGVASFGAISRLLGEIGSRTILAPFHVRASFVPAEDLDTSLSMSWIHLRSSSHHGPRGAPGRLPVSSFPSGG